MPMPDHTPSLSQLQRALEIAEEIQRLEEELQSVLGGRSVAGKIGNRFYCGIQTWPAPRTPHL
jgi:hypothetical protein